jgi:hypothetical protein
MRPNHVPERELRPDPEPDSEAMFQDAVMRLCLDAALRASCSGSPAQLASHFPGLENAGWVAEADGTGSGTTPSEAPREYLGLWQALALDPKRDLLLICNGVT